MHTNGKLNLASSILVGGVIGAGAALLLAPQSGKRTRRDIKRFGQRMGRSVGHVVDDVTDKMQDGLHWTRKATKGFNHVFGSGTSYVREGIHRFRRAS